MGDVFRLQDELSQRHRRGALAVARAARGTARGAGCPRAPAPTSSTCAPTRSARDWAQLPVARDLYLQCVDEDPGFAPAWARLGRAHRMIGKYTSRHAGRATWRGPRSASAARSSSAPSCRSPTSSTRTSSRRWAARSEAMVAPAAPGARDAATTPSCSRASCTRAATAGCSKPPWPRTARRAASIRTPATSVVYTWWARGDDGEDRGRREQRRRRLRAARDGARRAGTATRGGRRS